MPVNMRIEESEPFKAWIEGVGKEGENVVLTVVSALGDYAKKESERQLKHFQRKGKLPKSRNVHMYQDVKKVTSKKYGYVSIGGGRYTGTLWHIVNDGTYRNRALHFIDAVLKMIDLEVERIWDDKGRGLGE